MRFSIQCQGGRCVLLKDKINVRIPIKKFGILFHRSNIINNIPLSI